jgi:ribonucleoside-triphosphate reductase
MNDACEKWKKETNIGFSIYGTPIESTTYKFAKCIQKRFGKVPGVSDKSYITNSYHVRVTENINAFDKLDFESKFQALSTGGAISYVEVPNLQQNIPAVLALIRHIYENIMYAELNTKSDYCQVCGYEGEILIVRDNGKLVWECPMCKNRDMDKMNVARRVCGYISSNMFNQGRTEEISERMLHL